MKLPFEHTRNTDDYANWRSRKLEQLNNVYSSEIDQPLVSIKDPASLSLIEKKTILTQCQQHNLCLYKITNENSDTKENIHQFVKQLGVSQLDNNICADEDKLTSITRSTHTGQHEYIPYSNKRLSWHTDGYYNKPDKQINSMLLHCTKQAKSGGVSLLMDHEVAYMLLRDENPDYINALMHPNAMTIPANILDGKIIREEQSGPVFSLNKKGGLHMRYSARKRNIEWRQDSPTLEAVSFLDELLNSDSKYIIKYTLQKGEGLICKNVLHRRTSFVDFDDPDKKRLLYRGRYFDYLESP